MAEERLGNSLTKEGRRLLNMDSQPRLENGYGLFFLFEFSLPREIENSFALLIYIYYIILIETQ